MMSGGGGGGCGYGREVLKSSMEERKGVVGPTVIIHTHAHTHTHVCSIPTTSTYSNIHACAHMLIYTYVCTQRLTCLQISFSFSLFLSQSPNTVVYCAAGPGPCPKAKRTQIAETEGPLLTGRPGCSCYSLLQPSKPMGTAS